MTLFKMVDTIFVIAGTLCGIGVLWKGVKNLGSKTTQQDRIFYRQLSSGMFAAISAHAICVLALQSDTQQRVIYAILPLVTLAAVWISHFVDLRRNAKGLPVV
jgi:hypothetical protein